VVAAITAVRRIAPDVLEMLIEIKFLIQRWDVANRSRTVDFAAKVEIFRVA
jgi:hypothetical protein